MKQNHAKSTVTAGLMTAIGLILPLFTGHAFGIPGTVLLPMHLPVLLCGLLCGPRLGALCGLATPLLSSLLTGMPALFPIFPMMAAQLIVLGLLSGLCSQKLRLPLCPSLLLSIAAGWCVYGLVFSLLFFGTNGQLRAPSVLAALTAGIPGLILQLTLLPIVFASVKRAALRPGIAQQQPPEEALRLLQSGQASCVLLQKGSIVYSADGRGVAPLLYLYEERPELLPNGFVVDHIIGKAAAMILVLGGVRQVHGLTMSMAATEYLTQHGVAVSSGCCVDVIANRSRDGICPLERAVLHIEDPELGLQQIKETIGKLMSGAS